MRGSGIPMGSASLYLASGISFLDEEGAVFQGMLDGWAMQQRGGRNLKAKSVAAGLARVRDFHRFTGEWPWKWTTGDFDEWMMHLVSVKRLAPSTIRTYQHPIRMFCKYLCSAHYGWVEECLNRFGTHPVQVCHEWNSVAHLQEYEGRPGRRPLTRKEVQMLLDRADGVVEDCLAARRKGALPAYRDATLLKVLYAWGLRISEAVSLDVTDFYANAHAPELGRYGMLQVRNGKSSAGGAPKRRSVVSLLPWAVEAVEDYVENVWPGVRAGQSNALWLSERGTRMRSRELQDRFAALRDELGLDGELSPHALRHSYVTHMIEDGLDPAFVQQQVGHAYQSTTAIYTAVSSDYANKLMRQALNRTLGTVEATGGML
ncbi:tyrosine recombinase XerC [Pseudarthrobacter polychromogenes]